MVDEMWSEHFSMWIIVPILSSHTLYQSQCELEPEILYRQTKAACNSLMFPQLAGTGILCGRYENERACLVAKISFCFEEVRYSGG
jgi:hypothetical protein